MRIEILWDSSRFLWPLRKNDQEMKNLTPIGNSFEECFSSTVFNYSENSENAESLLMFCLKILDNHRYASLIIDNESFSEGHPILFVFMKSFPFPRKMQLLLRKKSSNHLQQRKKNSSPLCLGSSLSLCVCVSTMPVRHRRNGASDR